MFDEIEDVPDVEVEKDSLGGGGFGPQESAIYDMTIVHAFGEVARSGAKALVLHTVTPDGAEVRQKLWVIGKNGKHYTEKNDTKRYLKGYNQANAICLLTVGKELRTLKSEKKVIELYDFDAGSMEPTPVDMYMDLIGKTFSVGLIKQIVDINKNTAAEGNTPSYKPTGFTREENEYDKIFCAKEGKNHGLTVVEVRAKETEPKFKIDWDEKKTGVTVDRSKDKKGHIPKGSDAGDSSSDDKSGGNTADDTPAVDPLFT